MAHPILVGTCNWGDHDDFYPPELRGTRSKERLSYYAQFFPLVEVDTTFYGIPKPAVTDAWAERTPPGFLFNVKAYKSLTGHERDGGAPRRPTKEEETDFLAAIAPLRDAGRLVALHYQFAPWMTNTPAAREWLLDARDRHPDDVLAIEFRHRSWYGERVSETEDLLRELDAVFVAVDAPQIGSATAPPHLALTSDKLCIVRFHGRNWRTWYIKNAKSSKDRFDYLYPPSELQQWVPTVVEASKRVPVHVLTNNNSGNSAVVNAFDLGRLLHLDLPAPPPPIQATIDERDSSAGRES